jgi:hypothetical protein
MGAREHGRFSGEEEAVGEVGDGGVFLAQGGVRFGDADEFYFGVGGEGGEEAADVVVDEAAV